ncbi:MAG: hypothetical protein AAF597_00195 [Bacteroidota bacterium]
MPELDDDKTDKLFQVGADRHDFEYNPAAWQQMEGLLDADDLVRKRRMWLAGGGILLLLLLGIAWWAYQPTAFSDANPQSSPQVKTERPDREVAKLEESIASQVSVPAASVSINEVAPKADMPVNGIAATQPSDVTLSSGTKANSQDSQTTQPASADRRNEPLATDDQMANPTISDNEAEDKLTAAPDQAQVHAAEASNRTVYLSLAQLPSLGTMTLDFSRDLPTATVTPAAEVPTFTAIVPKPGLAVGVSVGAVSGMTSLSNPGPIDLRVGATVDYRFSNKLSLGTGGYLSRVCYQADGKDYKANEGFFDVIPKEVIADCDILEVPLNLTWHPAGSDRSGIYLGAGLSSYFMLTEKFDFKYDVPDDNLVKSWREDNTNRHLLGVGQVKFGYQRKSSQRSALQVESFLQLPLTGLGHGKVNFFSVGASVNYTFDFRKQR